MGAVKDKGSGRELIGEIVPRLVRLSAVVNVAGALVTFLAVGFLIPVFYEADQRTELGLENFPLVVVSVAIGAVVTARMWGRDRRLALGWLAEGRDPTEEEHRLTLRLASRATTRLAIAWGVSAVVFALINLHESLGFAAVVAAAIWMGGETTGGLAYLLLERGLRPITARALAARLPSEPVAPGVRGRLLIAWSLGTGVPIIGLLTVAIVGVTNSDVETQYVAGACIFLGAVALVVGLLATMIAARAIADPVMSVRTALEKVGEGDFAAQVPIDDGSEVGHLVGSTSMALAMPPTEVVRLLNRFFRIVVEVVESEDGLVNKFEGDAALCVFGAPVAVGDPAGAALRTARKLAERLDREVPEVGYGIGVSAGKAVAGNVGAEHRFEYTVIGDPINEAARLCELAKERGEHVIASEASLERSRGAEADAWSVSESVVLRGRLEATGLAVPRERAPVRAT